MVRLIGENTYPRTYPGGYGRTWGALAVAAG